MKISGAVYIIIGAFIVGFSYYVSSVNEKLSLQKFMLFIWVGSAFVLIGAGKIIYKIMSMPRKIKAAEKELHQHQTHQKTTHIGNSSNTSQSEPFVKSCSRCGNTVRHFDNFCYKCGSRVFHRK